MAVERRATASDIDRLIEIRGLVRENCLANPLSVMRSDYDYFVGNGRVWVAEVDSQVAGFSASDGRDGSIWALFLDPAYEGAGLGARLLSFACLDLAQDGHQTLHLTTDAGTKAEALYRKLGWVDVGVSDGGELKFELSFPATA